VLETGALAPHFTLLGIDGHEYSLPNDLAGQPAVLVFFKTSCETCDVAFPYLNKLREAYPDGWHIWAIAQDPPDKARAYAERHGITFPVLIDAPAYEASLLYDPEATPTIFLVDEKGRTEFDAYGFAKEDVNRISKRIALTVGAQPVVVAPHDDGSPAFKPG
jgi:peroxiredoxin